jgi:hypothetical protein
MARQALAAKSRVATGSGDPGFLDTKIVTARFYCEQILPQSGGLLGAITAGSADLLALAPDQF